MPAKPWATFRQPDPEREYLVLLTALPVKRFRDLGTFLLYTWRIAGQLRRTPGVLGYSLLARILQKQFAQFIRICRWLKLIHKERLVPLYNAPFSKQWTRKRCSVAQRFRHYLRATNCYKLSDQINTPAHIPAVSIGFLARRMSV